MLRRIGGEKSSRKGTPQAHPLRRVGSFSPTRCGGGLAGASRCILTFMIRELSVQNLALIEDVRVELQPGFCAWTGETGAGKSLLLGGLGLLLGERGNVDLLRNGTDELRITGRFELEGDGARAEIERILDVTLE